MSSFKISSRLRTLLDIIIGHISFFTIIPVRRHVDIRLVLRYVDFAVFTVSTVTLLLLLCVYTLLSFIKVPLIILSTILYMLNILLTGFLHLDGFTDVVDALFAPRERKLQVLKDPSVGACGVAALVLLISLGLVSTLCLRGIATVFSLYISDVAARVACSVVARLGKPLHAGLGSILHEEISKLRYGYVVPILYLVIMTILISPKLLAAILVALAIALVIAKLVVRDLGGISGDVLGFSIELTRHLVLCAAACAVHR